MPDAAVDPARHQQDQLALPQQPGPRQYSTHGTSSAFSSSSRPDEDWTKISDLAERRRIQNRIAQRNYRKKLKRRLQDLEQRDGSDVSRDSDKNSVAGSSVAGSSVAGSSVAGSSVAGSSIAGSSIAGSSVAGSSVAGSSTAESSSSASNASIHMLDSTSPSKNLILGHSQFLDDFDEQPCFGGLEIYKNGSLQMLSPFPSVPDDLFLQLYGAPEPCDINAFESCHAVPDGTFLDSSALLSPIAESSQTMGGSYESIEAEQQVNRLGKLRLTEEGEEEAKEEKEEQRLLEFHFPPSPIDEAAAVGECPNFTSSPDIENQLRQIDQAFPERPVASGDFKLNQQSQPTEFGISRTARKQMASLEDEHEMQITHRRDLKLTSESTEISKKAADNPAAWNVATLGSRTSRTKRWAAKSRSGCTTCRIRRIKCDETGPQCTRCLTSGRFCDWGMQRPFPAQSGNIPAQTSLTIEDVYVMNLAKKQSFEQSMVSNRRRTVDNMARIRAIVTAAFRSITTGASTLEHGSITMEINWHLRNFLKSQFAKIQPESKKFSSIITLTGSPADAQGLTICEYLSQTWPEIADKLLQLLPASIDPNMDQLYLRQARINSATLVRAFYHSEKVLINAVGLKETLIQVLQAFTWLGSVVRVGPTVNQVWESVPIFTNGRQISGASEGYAFSVNFVMQKLPAVTEPGSCWHGMFQGAMLASGFPIKARATKGLGLEMPLHMLADFGGSQRVTEWGDKVFIKGYSTILVAIKSVANVLVWHYYFGRPGERLSYMDSTDEVSETFNMAALDQFRHVVGWCSKSKYCAGAPDAQYNIRGTHLPRPSAGFLLEKVSISTGKVVSGGATFAPGVKETPPHLARNGKIPKLRWLSRKYVVFWDEEAKRGWLVNGTSALLHLVRASLEYYEKDEFSVCFKFDKGMMNNLEGNQYKPNTAIGILTDAGNHGLCIYPDKISQREEATMSSGEESYSTSTQTTGYFLFGDLVDQHLSALEQIIDYHAHLAGRDGINLKMRLRKHLEGWDFADLATDYDPVPRVATIPTLGHGWVDFVRSIGAITLFGRGFGELLQPVPAPGMCPRWNSLPTHSYLLAASVADLQRIMERYGDPYSVPREIAQNILWHSPAETVAACPCQGPRFKEQRAACHVDPVQVLLPSSSRRSGANDQNELEQEGAVVFGHNAAFGYRWPESGTQEVPVKDFLVPLRNLLPIRLHRSKASDETPDETPDEMADGVAVAAEGLPLSATVSTSSSTSDARDSGDSSVDLAAAAGCRPRPTTQPNLLDLMPRRRGIRSPPHLFDLEDTGTPSKKPRR